MGHIPVMALDASSQGDGSHPNHGSRCLKSRGRVTSQSWLQMPQVKGTGHIPVMAPDASSQGDGSHPSHGSRCLKSRGRVTSQSWLQMLQVKGTGHIPVMALYAPLLWPQVLRCGRGTLGVKPELDVRQHVGTLSKGDQGNTWARSLKGTRATRPAT
ncbi:hypothetical protein ACOMHN_031233 [Nucella lapillus]